MISRAIHTVMQKHNLSTDEMYDLMEKMTAQPENIAQIAAFLTALQMKGVSADELTGAAKFLRERAIRPDLIPHHVVDIVGTGGDHAHSFNISTTSAFVVAATGIPVIKHGNRASSSLCGSADVLEALGYNLDLSPERSMAQLHKIGIAFLFARNIHPILKAMAPLRKQLGIRTIFNMVGPLCNPIRTDSIVLGVYAAELTELYAHVLRQLGFKRALVVHGMDGLDEMSCCARTRVSELRDSQVKTFEVIPELLLPYIPSPDELKGGLPHENAEILKDVLSGKNQKGPRAAVLLNAGAAIYLQGEVSSIKAGIQMAEEAINSGAADQKLKEFVETSHV